MEMGEEDDNSEEEKSNKSLMWYNGLKHLYKKTLKNQQKMIIQGKKKIR